MITSLDCSPWVPWRIHGVQIHDCHTCAITTKKMACNLKYISLCAFIFQLRRTHAPCTKKRSARVLLLQMFSVLWCWCEFCFSPPVHLHQCPGCWLRDGGNGSTHTCSLNQGRNSLQQNMSYSVLLPRNLVSQQFENVFSCLFPLKKDTEYLCCVYTFRKKTYALC